MIWKKNYFCSPIWKRITSIKIQANETSREAGSKKQLKKLLILWKGHFSHQTEKEETNTVSEKECQLPMAVKYWKPAVQKEEKNWLFLTNHNTKGS